MKTYLIGLFLTLTFSCLITTNCSPKSKALEKMGPMNITLKVTKGRSPKKPHYSIELIDNQVNYNGIANMAVLGKKSYELSNQEYKTVYAAFSKSEFSSFEESYIGRIRDLPIFTLSYNDKVVKYQEREAPEEVLALATIITNLAPKNSN